MPWFDLLWRTVSSSTPIEVSISSTIRVRRRACADPRPVAVGMRLLTGYYGLAVSSRLAVAWSPNSPLSTTSLKYNPSDKGHTWCQDRLSILTSWRKALHCLRMRDGL